MAESHNVREYQYPDNKLYTGDREGNNKSMSIILFIILICLKISIFCWHVCIVEHVFYEEQYWTLRQLMCSL